MRDRARLLRRHATPAERALWQALRNWQLGGIRFRRQVPIGPYIADFFCPPAHLVVEVDGATHADSRTDPARDRWMAAQGLRVLRVWNNDVLGNMEGVLAVIREAAGPGMPRAPRRSSPLPGVHTFRLRC